jgi:hypothetical protein
MTGDNANVEKPSRYKRRSYLLTRITFSLSRGYYKFVYHLIKDKRAAINELPNSTNWLQLDTSNVNKDFLEGKTALILCSYLKESDVRISMARMLIENGAVLNMVNPKNGCNALHYSCALLCFDLIDYYLNSMDFDLSLTDFNGNTPLFYLISSLHLVKLNEAKLRRGVKIVGLYLQISKHYSFNLNPTNRNGINLTSLCKLIGNKEIYEMFKSVLNGTNMPTVKSIQEANERPDEKSDLLLDNSESFKNAVPNKTSSDNCSFLDEIVNFKKWSRPLIKEKKALISSSKHLDNQNSVKLRTHSSTPIVRMKKVENKNFDKDGEFVVKSHAEIREVENILKKHLLIDVNEIKYKRIEYAKEADEKLVKIYINRLSGFDDTDIYCLNSNLTTDVVIIKPDKKQGQTTLRTARSTLSLSQNANLTDTDNNIKIYRSRSAVQIACIEEKNIFKETLFEPKLSRAQSAQVQKSRIPTKTQKKSKMIDAKLDYNNLTGNSNSNRTENDRSLKINISKNINTTANSDISNTSNKKLKNSETEKFRQSPQSLSQRSQFHYPSQQQFQFGSFQKPHNSTQLKTVPTTSQQILNNSNNNQEMLFKLQTVLQTVEKIEKQNKGGININKFENQKRFKFSGDNCNWKDEFRNFYEKFEATVSKSYRKHIKPVFEEPKSPSNENLSDSSKLNETNTNKSVSTVITKGNDKRPMSAKSVLNGKSSDNKLISMKSSNNNKIPAETSIAAPTPTQRASGWINNPHNPHNHISNHK